MIDKVRVEILGKNHNYFLKELLKQNINIYDLKEKDKSLLILIDNKDYKKIQKMKTTYKIKIVERLGVNKYYTIIKKYLLLITLSIIGILINILLSKIIFTCEIIVPNQKLKTIIYRDLEENGIKKYHFKPSYTKREKIKKIILNKEKNTIEWLEIEEHGTKIIVKVEERKKKEQTLECSPRNLVSKKNALIKEIYSSAGEILKKIDDYVSIGETIVSGEIHNKEEVVSKQCAEGIVYGETWYKTTILFPKTKAKIKRASKYKYGLGINILDKKYQLFINYKAFKEISHNIIDSSIIPFRYSLSKYYKETTVYEEYNIKTIDEEAIKKAEETLLKKLPQDSKIISKKVLKKSMNNSKIEIDIFFKVIENITDYQIIQEDSNNE